MKADSPYDKIKAADMHKIRVKRPYHKIAKIRTKTIGYPKLPKYQLPVA